MIDLEEEKNEKRFKDIVMDRISDGTSKRVPITFPKEVFESFDEYSKARANHCYWLAIKILLEEQKRQEVMDAKTLMLIERDNQLSSDITKVNQRIDIIEEDLLPKKEVRRHFGKKETEENENEK